MDSLPAVDADDDMGTRPLKLRVKYCGGCNPDIDRTALVARVLEAVAASGLVVQCTDDDADVILLVNGCPRACLEHDDRCPAQGTPRISVQGAQVDHEPAAEACLHEIIVERIRKAAPADDNRGGVGCQSALR